MRTSSKSIIRTCFPCDFPHPFYIFSNRKPIASNSSHYLNTTMKSTKLIHHVLLPGLLLHLLCFGNPVVAQGNLPKQSVPVRQPPPIRDPFTPGYVPAT